MIKAKKPVDRRAATYAVRDLLIALGFDPQDPSIVDTPDRVARMYEEILTGYQQDDSCLKRTFDSGASPHHDAGIVVLKDIEFYSSCEHHLLPFEGVAHVAYLPKDGKVVGLSKLARIVDVYARRLQLQERMTREIADAIENELSPAGVGVIVRAHHGCMACRGVRRPEAAMVTSVMRGVFRQDPSARAELMELVLHV